MWGPLLNIIKPYKMRSTFSFLFVAYILSSNFVSVSASSARLTDVNHPLAEAYELLKRLQTTLREVQAGVAVYEEVSVHGTLSEETESINRLAEELKVVVTKTLPDENRKAEAADPAPVTLSTIPDADHLISMNPNHAAPTVPLPLITKNSDKTYETVGSKRERNGAEFFGDGDEDFAIPPPRKIESHSSSRLNIPGLDAGTIMKRLKTFTNGSTSNIFGFGKQSLQKAAAESPTISTINTPTSSSACKMSSSGGDMMATISTVDELVPLIGNMSDFINKLSKIASVDRESVKNPTSSGQSIFEIVLRRRCADKYDLDALSIIRLLLGGKHFSVNLSDGESALAFARQFGDTSLVEFLLKCDDFKA